MTHLLDGLPNPRKLSNSQDHSGLDKHLTRQLNIYGIKDPPVRWEKATPLVIVHSIMSEETPSSDRKSHQIPNLVQLGF